MKKSILRKIRNIAISSAVILLILVGAGVGYTFYMSKTETPVVSNTPEPVVKASTVKHAKIAANAPASASVQSLTTPVMPGDNALISVKSNPGSECSIVVEYNKVASKDSGLRAKTSDEFGIVTWSWTVDPSAPIGKWPVTVTCVYNKKSAVVEGKLDVSKTVTQ